MKIRSFAALASLVLVISCVYDELPVDKVPEVVDCNTVTLSISVPSILDASVCGATDGRLVVTVTGGDAPYTYAIDDGEEQSSPIFENLSSKIYSITVFDKNRCSVQLDRVLITVTEFSVDFTQEHNSECLDYNGAIGIVVNETNGPYQFKLDSGDFVATPQFENVKDGDHYVEILDIDGCSVTRKVTVERESTDVSWENDILPIFTTSCAITGCHNGVHLPRDWRVYSQVKTFASTIRKRTQDKSMPAEGTLTADEIALIACWIDDGAVQN